MTRNVRYADPNMLHEAVLFYRETFNKTPNAGFRRDIVVTVKTYEDLCIWQDLLSHWGYWRDGKYHKRNPLDIKGMLTCFEFKQREKQREIQRQDNLRERGRERVSERSHSPLPSLRRSASGWKG